MAIFIPEIHAMESYTVQIQDQTYQVVQKGDDYLINDTFCRVDWIKTGENTYHLLLNNKSFTVEVAGEMSEEKKLILKVNGNEYTVIVKDRLDLLLEKLGMSRPSNYASGSLQAPMPGKVLKILVTEGQQVKQGDTLLILEAMKMENSIKAPGNGRIKKVAVKEGEAIEKGAVMIAFD
ncbi:MAG: acetyl-CoA carboxylase biotin carboxyl carrier protein subunit [Chitinophagales bacterium]|nr:MAG: acetyl-CoA carboxylase biotin carboxyl carrier protein subunit [Chitinophagales bacterium]